MRRVLIATMVGGLALGAMPATVAGAVAPRDDPPTAGLTATASVDRAIDTVIVDADLTVAGTGVAGEPVSLYIQNSASPTFYYYDVDTTSSDGSVQFFVDGSNLAASVFEHGPFVFELRHAASTAAGAATADVNVTPAPTSLAIDLARTVTTYGAPVTITGRLAYTAGGTVPTNTVVRLYAAPAAKPTSWHGVGSALLSASGTAVFVKAPAHNTRYRLTFASDSPAAASVMSAVSRPLEVRQRVSLVLSPTVLPIGGTSHVSVKVGPRASGKGVTLERFESSHWVTLSHSHLSSTSVKIWSLTERHIATERLRVVRPATSTNAAGTSVATPLTIEKHGGGKTSAHTFLFQARNGKPIRWNPCEAIHYRVNLREAPAHALAEIKETLRRISQPTGISFVYDGTTHDIPSLHRRQTAPLTIAWARPNQTSYPLGDGVLGEGGGDWKSGPGFPAQVVSGYAVLLAHQGLTPGFGSGVTEGALLMHELGHAMGLNHTTESSQIMFPDLIPRSSTMYGAGDYRGLELLGRSQGCL